MRIRIQLTNINADPDPAVQNQCGSGFSWPESTRIWIPLTKINADPDPRHWPRLCLITTPHPLLSCASYIRLTLVVILSSDLKHTTDLKCLNCTDHLGSGIHRTDFAPTAWTASTFQTRGDPEVWTAHHRNPRHFNLREPRVGVRHG